MKPIEEDNGSRHAFEEIESMMQQAGEISSRLWSRRMTFQVLGLDWLRAHPFEAGSEIMRPHALHRLYEDDNRCNGWKANIVVHPAVLGIEIGDSKDGGVTRVLVKAEVLLGKH